VGPVLIVVDLVLAQDPPEMALIPDQGAVQKFAPASPNPAFGYRVRPGCPDVAEHGPDPGAGEDRVGRGCVVRAAVADDELDLNTCATPARGPGSSSRASASAGLSRARPNRSHRSRRLGPASLKRQLRQAEAQADELRRQLARLDAPAKQQRDAD
jgi:hypothetical protein